MFRSSTIALLVGVTLGSANAQGQTTWHVDISNCPGPGSGTQADPFCKIQDGIDVAVDGDTVLIADGTYTGIGNKNLSFEGKAITVQSANGPENCVIDCEGGGRGFIILNGGDQASRLIGLTITNGQSHWRGGGIYCSNSILVIDNCVLTDNTSLDDGGGIYIDDGEIEILNSLVANCCAVAGGGGVLVEDSIATVVDSDILFNSASGGGGILTKSSSLDLLRSRIIGNEANSSAGLALGSGGVSSINNCVIAANIAFGTVAVISASPMTMTNCSVISNISLADSASSTMSCSPSSCVLKNCVLWNNFSDTCCGGSGTFSVTYSDIEGGFPGPGNIDADPIFWDPSTGFFHLTPNSPCVDAGNNSGIESDALDLDRENRISSGTVDMGADEFHDCDGNGSPDVLELLDGSAADCNENNTVDTCDIDDGTSFDKNDNGIPDECECPADFDGSGDVNAADLAELLSSWGPCVDCPADFDGDGLVGAKDLADLLAAWGPCE